MGPDDKKAGANIESPPEVPATGTLKDASLPAIAAKADDLLEIKKAVEDAASVSGGLWLSYLFVLFYIAIAAGAVTHEDLLLERAVKLPFLNIELPLLAFFALAPFIVLIIHAYALMHFIMLGKKASRFHNELRRQFPIAGMAEKSGAAPDADNKEIRDKLRRLLPSNIFVQILAGPPELRGGVFGFLLKLIALLTLVVFPILVLLLLQIQFLPFHDVTITWAQRIALFLDILFLWLLRPPNFGLSVESYEGAHVLARILRGIGLTVAGAASVLALWLSIVIATIPGEQQENWQTKTVVTLHTQRCQICVPKEATLFSTHDLLFAGKVDGTTRRRKSLFSNTLVLPGFNLHEALNIDDPKKLAWKEHLFDLRGRHFEKAALDGADLAKADLMGAQLQNASLVNAQLWGASLEGADLQGASLEGADFHGATLRQAQLQGATLINAYLQGASLDMAELQGAVLDQARLQGASLVSAQLQGASLFAAALPGASLRRAQLQGAVLEAADLEGALLDWAQLQGALLDYAYLQGASLVSAQMQGAAMADAELNAANFSGAFFWRTGWGELNQKKLGAVRLGALNHWKPVWQKDITDPVPWDTKAYAELRDFMNSIPDKTRGGALKRIERLDCTNPDKTLASCDPAVAPPPEVLDWQKELKAASANEAAYEKALAKELRRLVCENDANAIHILHGFFFFSDISMSGRIAKTGREAPALVDFIMSKDCPVSAALTEDDKAKLLEIKQLAEKNFPPPPAARKDK
jgi:uncharacterized protein YjbI with pentapeptide repeats